MEHGIVVSCLSLADPKLAWLGKIGSGSGLSLPPCDMRTVRLRVMCIPVVCRIL